MTGGIAPTVTNVVENLGLVLQASAIRGVEVSAPIASDGSVIFQFQTQAAGNYLLKVHYSGEGLALNPQGPSGASPALFPESGGTTTTVSLPLEAASYSIKAVALGDKPVFVDWELLLNTGVGQTATANAGPTWVNPATVVPLPASASASASVVGLASPVVSPTSLPTPSNQSATSSPTSTNTISFATFVVNGPVGRPKPVEPIAPVGPITAQGTLALAFAAEGLPPGLMSTTNPADADAIIGLSLETDPLASRRSGNLEILGDVEGDQAALVVPAWHSQLVELQGEPTLEVKTAFALSEAEAAAAASRTSSEPGAGDEKVAATTPGLIAGLAVAVAVVRRWRPRVSTLPRTRLKRITVFETC